MTPEGVPSDNPLIRPVALAAFNREEARRGSPVRVADRNANGLVDEEDDFGAADPSYVLHRMCMERLPYPAAARQAFDRLGLSWFDAGSGTWFMDVALDARAERLLKRTRERLAAGCQKRGTTCARDFSEFGRTPDLGLYLYMGLGSHAAWLSGLRKGTVSFFGKNDRTRSAFPFEGGFDARLNACHFHTRVKMEAGRWLRHRLKITVWNATGKQVVLWNMRTGVLRAKK